MAETQAKDVPKTKAVPEQRAGTDMSAAITALETAKTAIEDALTATGTYVVESTYLRSAYVDVQSALIRVNLCDTGGA